MKKKLDVEKDRLLEELSKLKPESEEYGIVIRHLELLSKSESYEKEDFDKTKIAEIAVNAALVIVVLCAENLFDVIINSKAWQRLRK